MKRTLALVFAVLLSACGGATVRKSDPQGALAIPAATSSQEQGGGYLPGDGPGADAPADLMAIPDAVPRAEAMHRYANRPYTALGKSYTPLTVHGQYKERGRTSWYGKKFHGRRTSSGEVYDMYGMTAAHPTLPIPSYARVTLLANNKSVIVRINDRGPFLHQRIVDLSYTAAYKLGIIGAGSGEVEVESLAADAVAESVAIADTVRNEPLPPAAMPVSTTPIAITENTAIGESIYLQLGAFSSRPSAESFQERMRTEFEGSGKQIVLHSRDELTRVHIGPYATAEEARTTAQKLQSRLGFRPFISVP